MVSADAVEQPLLAYAQEEIGSDKKFTADSRVCGDLGMCDEDLWEMIDAVLGEFEVTPPSNDVPAHIEVHQRDLTFCYIAEWICSYSQRQC